MLTLGQVVKYCKIKRLRGEKVVVTNGCFDLIHAGHVTYLEQARAKGDCLVVAVNADESVRALKGAGRPINNLHARLTVLAALESVSAVVSFDEPLAVNVLTLLRPSLYVKGGDYDIADLNPAEVATVKRCGGKVVVLSLTPGISTTAIIEKTKTH